MLGLSASAAVIEDKPLGARPRQLRAEVHLDHPEYQIDARGHGDSDWAPDGRFGQDVMVERLMIGLLTGGHILLEGVPGLAKTLAVKTVAARPATTRRVRERLPNANLSIRGVLSFVGNRTRTRFSAHRSSGASWPARDPTANWTFVQHICSEQITRPRGTGRSRSEDCVRERTAAAVLR